MCMDCLVPYRKKSVQVSDAAIVKSCSPSKEGGEDKRTVSVNETPSVSNSLVTNSSQNMSDSQEQKTMYSPTKEVDTSLSPKSSSGSPGEGIHTPRKKSFIKNRKAISGCVTYDPKELLDKKDRKRDKVGLHQIICFYLLQV